jgi:3-phenylpropionate/trans-cinnamate dioxygenase ferredoxin reductase component
MSNAERIVIVGASLAGASAAETLRKNGWTGQLVLVGSETKLPYERPPLSKSVLLGKDRPDVGQVHDRPWYDDNLVELRLGVAATALDTQARTVALADGSVLGYDRLLIATGSRVRKLDVPGAHLPGVHYLRTAGESEALTEAFATKPRVVVIGAGWIGLEVGAAARERGCDVTVIEPQATALAAVLGEKVGGLFADLHRRHGVDLRFGTGVNAILGEDRVTGVETDRGDTIPADLVVVGIGVQPNTELAEAAGIKVASPQEGAGILTGPDLRSSVPEVFAAGDVARWEHPLLGRSIRVEHWSNAKESGAAAAKAMAGQDGVYDSIPYFFTDQYDLGMEYVGDVPRGTSYEVVLRGDPTSGAYLAFWLDDSHRVLAGMQVNTWDTIDAIRELVRSKAPVDPARLVDQQVGLTELGNSPA